MRKDDRAALLKGLGQIPWRGVHEGEEYGLCRVLKRLEDGSPVLMDGSIVDADGGFG